MYHPHSVLEIQWNQSMKNKFFKKLKPVFVIVLAFLNISWFFIIYNQNY